MGDRSVCQSSNARKAGTSDVLEPDRRIVMAVMAMGMIVGALLSPSTKAVEGAEPATHIAADATP